MTLWGVFGRTAVKTVFIFLKSIAGHRTGLTTMVLGGAGVPSAKLTRARLLASVKKCILKDFAEFCHFDNLSRMETR